MPAQYTPTPTPMNMKPSWLTVEYARTFLMSYWKKPIDAAKMAVSTPTTATTVIAGGLSAKRKFSRATMYTPAVTIVAAWISAETGVGPAIASGNQMYKGSCALLPVAPMKRQSAAIDATPKGSTPELSCANPTVPVWVKRMKIPMKNP